MTTDKIRQAGTQQAQQARRQQEKRVQAAAQTIQQEAPNITNVPLGSPLDPSQGYSFAPGSRPPDLPIPGDSPGGAPERSSQSIVTLGDEREVPLQDDHDAIFREDPKPRPTPTVHQGEALPEHPILTKLRQDLGIEQIRPIDIEVGGHRWTMTILSPGDVALAARLADTLADTPTERQIIYQGAVVAHAIVAIDGVPTYQVFGIVPMPGIQVTDHFRPPKSMRFASAAKLFDFINDGARTQLNEKLYDAYLDRVDQSGVVHSYLDDPNNQKVRFRCPEPGCGHELRIVPRRVPGTKDFELPFCQWHGRAMEIVKEVSTVPLP